MINRSECSLVHLIHARPTDSKPGKRLFATQFDLEISVKQVHEMEKGEGAHLPFKKKDKFMNSDRNRNQFPAGGMVK